MRWFVPRRPSIVHSVAQVITLGGHHVHLRDRDAEGSRPTEPADRKSRRAGRPFSVRRSVSVHSASCRTFLPVFFIITERQYGFGDTVRLAITGSSDDAEGVIEDVTLRVTRMRNSDGEVITVPNGQIVKATNLSQGLGTRRHRRSGFRRPADLTRVNEVLRQVGVDAMGRPRTQENCCSTSPRSWASKAWRSIRSTCGWSRAHSLANSSRSGRALRVRVAAALRRQGITVSPDLHTVRTEEASE